MTASSGEDSSRNVLILWADNEMGIRSVGRTLCGILEEEPHGLTVTWVDLPEALQARSLVQQVANLVGDRLESAVVTTLGWQAVEERLAGRQPRVVVAMDPVAAAAVDGWRGKDLLQAPLVGIVSSLRLDPAWAHTAVDRLSVADELQAERGLKLGLPAECLVPGGIPVCGGFSDPEPDNKEQYRQRFGLPVDRPLVLMVTEGLNHEQLTGALFQLSMVADKATVMFDVARDDEGADLLRRRASLYGIQARMFGKVEEAGELWAAADLVVARPQLYVEQRVVAQRLPLVCIFPKNEAERQKGRIYKERGIGRDVSNLATLAADIDMQLDAGAMEEARLALGAISRRHAAEDMARLVSQVRAQAQQILAESRELAKKPAPQPEETTSEPRKTQGPQEIIGVGADPAAPEAFEETLEDLEEAEAEAGRPVLKHQKEAERWSHRADLARDKDDEELVQTATAMAERHQTAMHRALADLARLAEKRQSKEDRNTRHGRLERTFRKLEVDDALSDLKKKMGW